jgi:transposase
VTKVRDPQSFEEAALVMARDFGAREAAKVVDRGEATIRRWTDPDKDGQPTIHQALRLDVEHVKSHGTAPFLQAYVAQLQERAPEAMRTRSVADIFSEAMDVPIEAGKLLDLLRRARGAKSASGEKLSVAEKAALQKEIKRLRDEIDDVEAALKKS